MSGNMLLGLCRAGGPRHGGLRRLRPFVAEIKLRPMRRDLGPSLQENHSSLSAYYDSLPGRVDGTPWSMIALKLL
jgi:hypothetical protein